MICTNCFEADYRTEKTEVTIAIDGEGRVLRDVECEVCPSCGDTMFTHDQSLEIDKKRVALEFGLKPSLTPAQLKDLRCRILNMNLDEICEVLHIGKNTYGRWERGDSDITPSMNLLVHNLIEKVPGAAVNLFPVERERKLDTINPRLLRTESSFGEYIRAALEATKLVPATVCAAVGITLQELTKLQNNEVEPEKIPVVTSAKILWFFRLNLDTLRNLMNNSLGILDMKSGVTAVHARSTTYDGKAASIQDSSVNKILEKLAQQKGGLKVKRCVSEEYLAKVNAALSQIDSGVGP
ncbi:type II toxin-antitoxin system MqsA family antitoxin [Geomesophilobacter sediminis]|uniref:Type II toxin-antitoxin system MqsA family antitoxin n=1 Tax=Geomesophilobacter sediminis TaxID=2798584 RepID=A0A8J7JC02_9BACT|nr:type II toxin-antitoxin system MqsA family antitoxin [Geomesophilobacter sediminis]MBJ6724193.1 type II toxin-antitoxin system MqsA family antitoxin [Geomesophilobacter sediminis]